MSKVALMCGHGRSTDGTWDCGTSYGGNNEAALMLPITKAVVKYLRASGVTVISDADANNNKNMIADVRWANKEKVAIYVSLHCDYYKAPSGTLPLYVSAKGKALATAINKAVVSGMSMKTRGVTKRTDLYELNYTDAPACIFETGSIKADISNLRNEPDKYGKLIAQGICNYLGVKASADDRKAYTGEYPNITVKTTTTASRGAEITAKAKEYAWPYGTASSKYSYSKGSARPAYKTALKKYMNKSAKVSQSDCGYFVSTCVRASGIAPNFLALKGTKESFPKVPSTMLVVHKGKKIPDGLLQAGDIIRYKKTSGQHTLMYYGGGKIAEAGREHQFPAIESDTKKYNKSNVKLATLEVIRANPTTKAVTRSYLQRGDSGEEIKKLQKYINWFFQDKYGKDVLTVDGKYGVNTENYAKLMQSELGFKDCDGLIGPKTVEAMKGWKQ